MKEEGREGGSGYVAYEGDPSQNQELVFGVYFPQN
jgi:hypothetical protein